MEITVTVKCVACEKRKEVKAGEVQSGDMPFCECGNVMIAESARGE